MWSSQIVFNMTAATNFVVYFRAKMLEDMQEKLASFIINFFFQEDRETRISTTIPQMQVNLTKYYEIICAEY